MKIKNGIIFMWVGTNASIPDGWSRVTDMDGKYPKGAPAGANPGVNGGAATHTHTSSNHSHTAQGHIHSVSLSAGICGNVYNNCGASVCYVIAHTHASFNSGAMSGFTCQSVAATYAAASNDPEFYSPIFITPTTSVNFLPDGVIALTDAATLNGFNICDGTNGTPNLANKFLKGAAAGADAGATGGSKQNTHVITHSHSTSHSHGATTSDQSSRTRCGAGSGSGSGLHDHTVTLDNATPALNDAQSLVTLETNIEPAYTKLLAVQKSGNGPLQYKMIALFRGLLTAIPSGWALCDGSGNTINMVDRHLKIAANAGEIGATGGSNTHTHAAQSHTHAGVSHSHTAPNAGHPGTYAQSGSSGLQYIMTSSGYHTVSTNAVNLVTDSATTAADSSNNEPEYSTVSFIKLISIKTGNVLLLNIH